MDQLERPNVEDMEERAFIEFMKRNEQFHERVASHLASLVAYPGQRFKLALNSAILSAEHGTGAFVLIARGCHAPGYTLLRPQFESLVRSAWLMHAASELWVDRLGVPLSMEAVEAGKDALMVADMFKALRSSETAPPGLLDQLEACRSVMWKALNSFAHGGLHPLSRVESGYPRRLSYDVLRNSNAMLAIASQLAAIVTGDQRNMVPVRAIHVDFTDCLPISGSSSD